MKLSVFLMATLVAFASMASAAPIFPTCIAGGTMASYVALGQSPDPVAAGIACAIRDKLFSSFAYTPSNGGNGPAVPASAVFLTPVDVGSHDPGITFSSNSWSVSGGASEPSFYDGSITFWVNVLPGGALIEDATLTMGSDSRVTGGGQATIGEFIIASDGSTELGGMQVDARGTHVDHTVFAPTNAIQVAKNFFIGVDQDVTGTARVYSFTQNFSEVPEPLGAILIGSGLLALGAWRRRGSRG